MIELIIIISLFFKQLKREVKWANLSLENMKEDESVVKS